MEVGSQIHCPGRFTPGETVPSTPQSTVGGSVRPRDGLHALKKRKTLLHLTGIEKRTQPLA